MTYFSRFILNTNDSDIHRLAQLFCTDSYSEHQQLWNMFDHDPHAKRDFIYRREQRTSGVNYYVVSQRCPNAKNDLFKVESKPYSPAVIEGQKLAFSLRVNPVVTKKDTNGKPHRHDVVMDAKKRMDYKNLSKDKRPLLIEIVQSAGFEWLNARSEKHGFAIDDSRIQVDGYEPQKARKKQKGFKYISYSTLDYSGILTVIDPTCFLETLKTGIGPAKAFGCGLLLVRKI